MNVIIYSRSPDHCVRPALDRTTHIRMTYKVDYHQVEIQYYETLLK